eukprot:jgi/Chrzof1/11167/Cz05g26120.t1
MFTFDTETTGFSCLKDAIVEMAVVDVQSRQHWSSLVNPGQCKLTRCAIKCHGIMDWQVRHSNTPYLADAFQQLVAFVEAQLLVHETPVLVAHNGISFDFPMLCSSLQPLRVPPSWTYLDTHTVCQCMKLKSVCALQNIKQETLLQHFTGRVPNQQHRALPDALELATLLPLLLDWAVQQKPGPNIQAKLLPQSFSSISIVERVVNVHRPAQVLSHTKHNPVQGTTKLQNAVPCQQSAAYTRNREGSNDQGSSSTSSMRQHSSFLPQARSHRQIPGASAPVLALSDFIQSIDQVVVKPVNAGLQQSSFRNITTAAGYPIIVLLDDACISKACT